jgi:hypothetical protein
MPLKLRWVLMGSAVVLLAMTAARGDDPPPRGGAQTPKAPSVEEGARRVRDILARANRLEMRWAWSGLTLDRVEPRSHTLVLKDGVIAGGAIPEPLFRQALARLAQAPMVPGPYTPYVRHTDDYPNISMTVYAGPDSVRFFTESQGRGHAPWGVEVDGQTYVVPSTGPAEAYDLLIARLEPPEVAKRMMMPPPPPPPTALDRLFDAIQADHRATAQELVAAAPALARGEGIEYTPLHSAAAHGRLEIARLLLATGARANADAQGLTPIISAAQEGHTDMVRLLVQAGGLRDVRRDGWAALGAAARNGHVETVRYLLSIGADVNEGGPRLYPPIACVLVPETLRLLIEAGADVNAKLAGGRTVLEMAAAGRCGRATLSGTVLPPTDQQAAVRMLVAAGAKP